MVGVFTLEKVDWQQQLQCQMLTGHVTVQSPAYNQITGYGLIQYSFIAAVSS